ncbi:hypothetical protein [Streptomyces cyaneofuscatus]|uniref:hypothetical protein n=1 Tax=Streptomyces cyaneofuscatus TaxID=66883 RepID=UPI003793ACE8
MTQPEPTAAPVYVRVGDGQDAETVQIVATFARRGRDHRDKVIRKAVEAITKATLTSPDDTPVVIQYEGEHGPETIQHGPRGKLYDLSNEAAQAAWPTTPPPAPGG